MFNNLKLGMFKNFQEASLTLGPFSLLIGANASGKSNLRDAFRFLHGIGRGYSLSDIVGERYGQGGELQWRGIRGGIQEIDYMGSGFFKLSVVLLDAMQQKVAYEIMISLWHNRKGPAILKEDAQIDEAKAFLSVEVDRFNVFEQAEVHLRKTDGTKDVNISFPRNQSILSQCIDHPRVPSEFRVNAQNILDSFASMRFLDLNPDAMRLPSFPGQTVLGDRGENLSSVLQAICAEPEQKQTLVQWLRELTPMDAVDFDFPTDQIGRVLVALVEGSGRRTTAYSASDGTLRFLGILAALLGPNPARFYFLEELENGIHPTRLHLLLQLIEQRVARGDVQVVATTHSPQLLGLVSKETLEHVSLIYRREGEAGAQIRRLLDLPHAQEILSEESLSCLHASGWLEDAVEFAEPVAAE